MATTKSSTIKRYNGSDYDTINPITTGQNVYGSGTNASTPLLNSNDKIDNAFLPSIPTVNDGTLTIQKNGSTVQTFTANQSSNVTANITVPTQVTDLSDASNYLNNSSTAQAKTGSLTLKGNLYIGEGIPNNGDGSTVYKFPFNVRLPVFACAVLLLFK